SFTRKVSNTRPSATPHSPSQTILARLGLVRYKSSMRCLSTSSSHSLQRNVVVSANTSFSLVLESKNKGFNQCRSDHGLKVSVICLKNSGASWLPLIDSTNVRKSASDSIWYASSIQTHA